MIYTFNQVRNILNLINNCFKDNTSHGEEQKYIHYTSQKSFMAMVKDYSESIVSKNITEKNKNYVTVFASQMQYLNDKQEYNEGRNVVKKHFEKEGSDYKLTDKSLFISCFCGNEDSLTQWKYYGKNCGISIEFDFNNTLLCWFDCYDDKNKEPTEPNKILWAEMKPQNVFYENHEEELKKIIERVNKNRFKDITPTDAADIFIPYCKNKHFIDECESRLVFYPIFDNESKMGPLSTRVSFRETDGKIVPQFCCKVCYNDENKRKTHIPIKKVMIGPGINQNLVFNSVIYMLEPEKEKIKFIDNGETASYTTTNEIVISKSNIPFRG